VSRIIAPAVLAVALLAAQPAVAGVSSSVYTGQTRLGIGTSDRSAGGSCSARAGSLTTDLVVRCGSLKGKVTVRYHFTLPTKKVHSVCWQVNYVGGHRDTKAATARSGRDVYVTVAVDDGGRADIESVMIEYYT